MLISDLIKSGSKILRENDISSHILDSELILAKVLKKNRENLLIANDSIISNTNIKNFKKLINRRVKKEPVAYLFNEKSFWNTNFFVNKNTLIPRPETELIVEKLIDYFKDKKPFILDIGTGSGCILISLLEEIKKAKGIGIDISKKALKVAKINAHKSGVLNRVKFIKMSIQEKFDKKFDLIVSNPPYICSYSIKNLSIDIKNFEPKIALDGGNDGLDVIKKVIYKAKYLLKVKGLFAIEIGNGQYNRVSQLLKKSKFRKKFLIKDYRKNIRCIISSLEQ